MRLSSEDPLKIFKDSSNVVFSVQISQTNLAIKAALDVYSILIQKGTVCWIKADGVSLICLKRRRGCIEICRQNLFQNNKRISCVDKRLTRLLCNGLENWDPSLEPRFKALTNLEKCLKSST